MGTEIKARISELLDKKAMTQESLAEAIGCNVNNLRQLLSGRRPMRKVVKKLAEFFGVSVEYLTTGKTDPKPPAVVYHTPRESTWARIHAAILNDNRSTDEISQNFTSDRWSEIQNGRANETELARLSDLLTSNLEWIRDGVGLRRPIESVPARGLGHENRQSVAVYAPTGGGKTPLFKPPRLEDIDHTIRELSDAMSDD